MKYIVEACAALLLAVVTVKTFQFFSNANLIKNPSGVIDQELTNKTSTKNPEGRTLFFNYCASCHSINKRITGPALAGITDRVRDRKLLIAWVKNSGKVLNSGNPYFNNLFQQYDRISMSTFPQLDDNQVESILAYIDGK